MSAFLLVVCAALVAACTTGALTARAPADRLHFVGPVTLVGAPLLAAGLWAGGLSPVAGAKALLAALFAAGGGVVCSHVVARVVHDRGEEE